MMNNDSNLNDFICCVCGHHFKNEYQYFGHLQIHSGEVIWKCSQCENPDVSFESQSKLQAHENLHHNLVKPFKCTKCDLVFDRASQLDYHTRSVHLCEKSQVCQICGKGFFRKTDLKTHLNVHLGTNQSICEICGRKFNHVSNLIRHCRTHAGLKPYPCSICGKRFNQVNSLARHKNIHERAIEGAAADHGQESAENGSVDQRKIIKRRHYCKICGESFQFIVLLRQHEKLHEKKTDAYYCRNCHQIFKSQEMLQQHCCELDVTIQQCEKDFKSNDTIVYVASDQPNVNVSLESLETINPTLRELTRKVNIIGIETDRDESINISDILSPYNCDEIELTNSDSIQRHDSNEIPKKFMNSEALLAKESHNKCLHIEGSQFLIEVSESDYLKTLGLHALEIEENRNIALLQENINTVERIDTFPTTVKNTNEEHPKPHHPVPGSNESAELCVVEKNLSEQWDLQSSQIQSNLIDFTNETVNERDGLSVHLGFEQSKNLHMTLMEDFHSHLIGQYSETFGDYSEVPGNNHDNIQAPMVRLVQNEEGEQFFELIREHLDFDTNKDFEDIHDQDFVKKDCSDLKKVDGSELQDNKKLKASRGKSSRFKECKEKFQCTVCKKLFSTAKNLKQHIGMHFSNQQKFQCKECGTSFAWRSTLNKHIASNHRPDGPLKFVCKICPKVYNTLSQVNEHVKRDHLKERKHLCSECGKSFFKKFDLKSHMRTHTNERPYICRACGKGFHHQSHIIRHERIHSGERPYSCNFCDRAFTQPRSLKAHKQRHQNVTKVDILDYHIDEDDPIALSTA